MIHSIFWRISAFFLVVLIALTLFFLSLQQKFSLEYEEKIAKEAKTLLLELRKSVPLPPSQRHLYLQEQGYTIAQPHEDLLRSLTPALHSVPNDFPEAIQDSLKEGRIQILKDDHHLYIYLSKASPPLLVIKADTATKPYWAEMVFGSIAFALILLYWLVIRTLFPLKKLIHTIHTYGKEGKYLPLQTTKKDEISKVAQALDSAMQKNLTLLDARRLFLRNIMHELKTPITAGKLALPFLKNSQEKSILERAFLRMEHLIAELVKVEQITSGAIAPNLSLCRPELLIEKARKLLFLEENTVEASFDDYEVFADCEVLVSVFKNLIDNGLKYSLDHKIKIVQQRESIAFYNTGEPWPDGCSIETLCEPFYHRYENSQSFGLGLYIVKSILDAHHFTLNYRYDRAQHCFEVVCRNPLIGD